MRSKPAELRRTGAISVRLTAAQRATIEELARAEDVDLSVIGRRAINAFLADLTRRAASVPGDGHPEEEPREDIRS
jgi:hypothetical protein